MSSGVEILLLPGLIAWKNVICMEEALNKSLESPLYTAKTKLFIIVDGVHKCYINFVDMNNVYNIMYTKGEGCLRPPPPLVRVAGATLISSEEVV